MPRPPIPNNVLNLASSLLSRGRGFVAVLLVILFVTLLLSLDGSKWIPSVGSLSKHSILAADVTDSPLSQQSASNPIELLEDGVLRYQRTTPGSNPELLWLVLTYDKTSWGKVAGSFGFKTQRSFEDFLQLVADADLDLQKTSLAVMTSSQDEFHHYIDATEQFPLARLTIFMHPGFNPMATSDREHRHDDNFQTVRRVELAQLRNYLMLRPLHNEQHIIWLDADVYHLDKGIIQRMIAHSETREDAGIITARCEAPWGPNYDLNAWTGPYKHAQVITDLVEGTTDDDLIELTAIGGTFLYMRASLVRRGVNFPFYYVINTKWTEDGDDGIETEGMCYQAKGLKGGGCFVMGGSWHTKHGD